MSGSKPQLQSSLGDVASNKNKTNRVWDLGSLAMGKVVKVHAKRYTADVKIFGKSNRFSSSHSQEGRYACRIGVSNAGYDDYFKKPYGQIVPIQKGAIVLVGFLDNTKEKPVILRVFHDISEKLNENNMKNILDSSYSENGDGEVSRYLNITPIQDFVSYDKWGNLEISSHTKSFFVAKTREIDEEYYDYEDLNVKKADNTTVSSDSKFSIPMRYLAVFRDNFVDSLTNWLKIFVDASKTCFRLSKIQRDNKLSFVEIDQDGGIKLRRQLDTKSFDGSKEYADVSITSDGKVIVEISGNKNTTITVDNSGIQLDTEGSVNVKSEEDINAKGRNVDFTAENTLSLTAEKIDAKGYMILNGRRVAVQGDGTSDGASIV